MSLATVNDVPVIGGRLTFPIAGAWTAELDVQGSDADALEGSVTIDVGGVSLAGTASVSEDDGGQLRLTVTAGAAGLGATVTPQHYVPPVTVRRVLVDALAIGGETLSPAADAATLAVELPQWTRAAGTVKEAVRRVVAAVSGAAWRHLPDGSVWVGPESWATFDDSLVVVESEEPTQSLATVALDSLAILPGVTFRDKRITSVEYTLDGAKLRARLSWGERVSPLRAMVREETAAQDYTAPYLATVVGQNGDGTLELRSGDSRIPSMSKVPIRTGVPGLTVAQVTSGAVAIVEFENCDPARPVVTGWRLGSATRVALDAEVILGGGLATTTRAAIAEEVESRLSEFVGAFCNAAAVPNDGGAGIQTSVKATLATAGWNTTTGTPPSVASSRVKVAT
jgi:hypothetical protein